MSSAEARTNPWLAALIAGGTVISASLVGGLVTASSLEPWYSSLNKPAFTPPNWLFGPAWTTLYILMAVAFWRILRKTAQSRRTAIIWFLVQITLNALWSVAFFGMQSPLAGLFVIALLLIAIVMTIISFAPLDRPAALLLIPYLAWVSFASCLNTAVWWLNP